MPELPEVETVRRGLEKTMDGKVIESVDIHRGGLRVPFPENLKKIVEGRKVLSLSRRAKYILIRLSGEGDWILVIHLGMSGHMSVIPAAKGYNRQKHDHMVLGLKGGQGIAFNDARRFGLVLLVREDELADHPAFKSLGPEPLDKTFTGKVLHERLSGKKTPVKLALLDQRVVAGIGNIYACEALYDAAIDPQKNAGSLSAAKCDLLAASIKNVLNKAIKAGGSSLKDHKQVNGELGYFQHSFLVYDREGQPCPRCAGSAKKPHTVKRIIQSGRSTFFCPGCQK